jgi:hypothetical protein
LDEFPWLSHRLAFVDICPDKPKNFELWLNIHVIEDYVFGVISEYERIKHNQPLPSDPSLTVSLTQQRLDIYYYTLTWDKLKKVFEKLKIKMNQILKPPNYLPEGFQDEYKQIKIRIDHLMNEYQNSVRDEFEHPSLQPSISNNMWMWGTIIGDKTGDLKAHVGKEQYAIVKKEHVDRLYTLWIELIDLFLKHFSSKPTSSSLLELKQFIENNINTMIGECERNRVENKHKDANQILNMLLNSELFLMKEGIPLRQEVRTKIFAAFYPKNRQD